MTRPFAKGMPISIAAAAAVAALGLLTPSLAWAQGAIQVTATTPQGAPVSGRATAQGQSGTYSCAVSGGRCVMSGVRPGSYTVTLSVPGRAAQRRMVSVGTTMAHVTFAVTGSSGPTSAPLGTTYRRHTPGGSPGSPQTVRRHGGPGQLSPAAGGRLSIQGTATTPQGRPVSGTVQVRRGGSVVGSAPVSGGRFAVRNLAPGTYTVTLRSVSGATTTRTVTLGSSPASVSLVVSR